MPVNSVILSLLPCFPSVMGVKGNGDRVPRLRMRKQNDMTGTRHKYFRDNTFYEGIWRGTRTWTLPSEISLIKTADSERFKSCLSDLVDVNESLDCQIWFSAKTNTKRARRWRKCDAMPWNCLIDESSADQHVDIEHFYLSTPPHTTGELAFCVLGATTTRDTRHRQLKADGNEGRELWRRKRLFKDWITNFELHRRQVGNIGDFGLASVGPAIERGNHIILQRSTDYTVPPRPWPATPIRRLAPQQTSRLYHPLVSSVIVFGEYTQNNLDSTRYRLYLSPAISECEIPPATVYT